jgi:CRISPR-associated endonuclease/helicase Cas3
LLAFLDNPRRPRRIVYIVDRRAVVDQTAETIRGWIAAIAKDEDLSAAFNAHVGLDTSPVGLGVLRGGLADDGDWRLDPSRPTIVVGTVDMVGSRLLFRGYGDGPARRAMHAGLLGEDAAVLLDEAHLSPALAGLLADLRAINPAHVSGRFETLSLSATLPDRTTTFQLDGDDVADVRIQQRLKAPKHLTTEAVPQPADRPAALAAAAHDFAKVGASVAVFVTSVTVARDVAARLRRAPAETSPVEVGVLTGTLRGAERAALVEEPIWERFAPGRDRTAATSRSILVMTAAGEVGVDLDADHAVMDAVPADRMVQRLGRVNRTGAGTAKVHVVYDERQVATSGGQRSKEKIAQDQAAMATLEALEGLPDLAPASLATLTTEQLDAGTTPAARPVPLHRTTVENLAATSADMPLPETEVFLRGIGETPEIPDTYLIWRWDAGDLAGRSRETIADALGVFPPRPAEIARVPTSEARTLIARAIDRATAQETDQPHGLPVLILGVTGRVEAAPARLTSEEQLPDLRYATVILPTAAGGLSKDGLPDPAADNAVPDVGDDAERTRGIVTATDEGSVGTVKLRVPLHDPDDDEAERRWLVYASPGTASAGGESDAASQLAAHAQTVPDHNARVAAAVDRIADALDLTDIEREALSAAGHWHDTGKARSRWQRAAGVTGEEPLAKTTRGRLRPEILAGYRHEFGSLIDAIRDLPDETPASDLTRHLIAAHHGHGRPGFAAPAHWDPDTPDAANRQVARETAARFGCLQAHYGPWRLAWLEALLRAADAWVSAERDREMTS